MKLFVYGETDAPTEREEIHEFDTETASGARMSNCRAYGQSSGSNHYATEGAKRHVKRETRRQHRRNEREFARECVKAHRAGGQLPQEPSPTVGGFYLY